MSGVLESPPRAMAPAAVDELLAGLGADDFDDFEDEVDEKEGGVGTTEEDDPHYIPPAPPPSEIPAVVSFATARGKSLAPPSEEAMSRAMKIVREAERDLEAGELPPKRRRVDSPTADAVKAEDVPQGQATPQPPLLPQSQLDSLATLHKPSLLATAGSPLPPSSSVAHPPSAFDTGSPNPGGFQLGSGREAPSPSAAARARVMSLFGESTDVNIASSSSSLSFSKDLAPVVGHSEKVRPPLAIALETQLASPLPKSSLPRRNFIDSAPRPTTSAREPLRNTTNTFAGVGFATPQPKKLSKRINIQTPGTTPRRIGLGSTSNARKARTGFSTPFKTGARPTSALNPAASPRPAAAVASLKPKREPVFDLNPPPLERMSMRASGVDPRTHSPAELAIMGLPEELGKLSYSNAILYQFVGDDASILGNEQALEHLKSDGCTTATRKWVDNHWALILWKLAGQVMANPNLFNEKWNWAEVINQLKYRYEREHGSAQRPIVRRIQEHDSSPALPMVLCVCGIHQPEPVLNEKDEPVPQRPYLELTDGWYRIRAAVDESLSRAISKGKIRVGRKLAMAGAKLESGAEGADVFAAFDKSHLVLSGNSCHLARWDTKLGVQEFPFIAALSSLTVDGGIIALMDVVLERVYPLAFMKADRGSREPPWNEEEEARLALEWKNRYEEESARLAEAWRKSQEKLEDLVSSLAYTAEDAGSVSGSPPDSLDDDFDDLLEADSKEVNSRLGSYSVSHITHLARLGRQRLQQASEGERAGFESQMKKLCPPREVRDFRMVRLRDAREGRKEATRTAMLNVWDARALGDELVEGKRFLISSVVPGRAGDWSAPKEGVTKEVYLHTRRDTRWQSVPEPAMGV